MERVSADFPAGPSAPAHNPAFWVDPGALPGAARLLAEIALTGLDELTAG